MTSLHEFVKHPIPTEEAPERIAARVVGAMSQQQRKDILLALITEWVVDRQRDEARRIERRSMYDGDARAERRRYNKRRDDLRQNDPDEYRRRYTFAGVTDQIEEMRRDIKLEVTTELLASTFALGDGRVVTWGGATAADHRLRANLLGQNAIGNLTTMLLHEQAAELIEQSGVRALGELPQAVAA